MAKIPTSNTNSVRDQTAIRTPKRTRSGAALDSVSSARLGLHGLGEILRTIHAAPHSLQEKFEQEMGNQDLVVMVNAATATKIKNFVTTHLPEHSLVARFNHDNCDPATDPWCINTF